VRHGNTCLPCLSNPQGLVATFNEKALPKVSYVSRDQAVAGHRYDGASGMGIAEYAGVPIPVEHVHPQPASQLYVEPVEGWQRSGPVEDAIVKASARSDWPSAVFLGGPVILVLGLVALFS
jgi:hypothetical protein